MDACSWDLICSQPAFWIGILYNDEAIDKTNEIVEGWTQKDRNLINFSSKQIVFHLNKLYSYPFYVALMTLLSSVVMLNLDRKRNRIFFITVAVLISVSIYFIRLSLIHI